MCFGVKVGDYYSFAVLERTRRLNPKLIPCSWQLRPCCWFPRFVVYGEPTRKLPFMCSKHSHLPVQLGTHGICMNLSLWCFISRGSQSEKEHVTKSNYMGRFCPFMKVIYLRAPWLIISHIWYNFRSSRSAWIILGVPWSDLFSHSPGLGRGEIKDRESVTIFLLELIYWFIYSPLPPPWNLRDDPESLGALPVCT